MSEILRTPVMTANNAPSPTVVSASSEFEAAQAAWKAFESPDAQSWASNTNDAAWLQIDFGSGNAYPISKYSITGSSGARSPAAWTLKGSNDGTNFDVLDTQSGQHSWSNPETRTFTFTNLTSYRYYRLDVTAVDVPSDLVQVANLALIEVVTSPSLSPSASISLSQSPSASRSPSSSISASISPSSSVSASLSPSASTSLSQSPSASQSPSTSTSPSPSVSPSTSNSPSPSIGFTEYTRGRYSTLPSDDADLTNAYTVGDVVTVSGDDNTRVGQDGAAEYMIHQFKNFVGERNFCQIDAIFYADLPASRSPVFLQIYNHTLHVWETLDVDTRTKSEKDIHFFKVLTNLISYKDEHNIITCRVYQLSI